jgi:hypothetical protein
MNADRMDPGQYSRELEAYLCRKNDGHLIRIAGPAFEKVCAWAEQGIPFKVACRGIDRYFERYYAKGPRRRPVRIEFCEADVLDAFDQWRRAIGVVAGANGDVPAREPRASLPAHLQRIVQKLTGARAASDGALAAALDEALDALDGLRATAASVRGDARTRALDRLEAIDRRLLEAVRGAAPADLLASLRREAHSELAGYAGRMAPEAFEQAVAAATERLLRERFGLPRIQYGV